MKFFVTFGYYSHKSLLRNNFVIVEADSKELAEKLASEKLLEWAELDSEKDWDDYVRKQFNSGSTEISVEDANIIISGNPTDKRYMGQINPNLAYCLKLRNSPRGYG